MSRIRSIAVALLGCALAAPVLAEKVAMSPAKKRDTATDVVVGTAGAIYVREAREGDYQVSHYAAEVAIIEVEKGERLAPGGLVYARYWTRRWVGGGTMPPGAGGHDPRPESGHTYRFYLAHKAYDGAHRAEDNADGGYNLLYRDGLEAVSEMAPTALTAAPLAVAAAGDRPAFRWNFAPDGTLAIDTGSDAPVPAAISARLLGKVVPSRTISGRWELRGPRLVLTELRAAEIGAPGPVEIGAVPLSGGGTVFLAGIEAALGATASGK